MSLKTLIELVIICSFSLGQASIRQDDSGVAKNSGGSPCPDGQVYVYGSCVDKVPFPPRAPKAACPQPVILNGREWVSGMSGRIIEFYCDAGFIRVPDVERSICQLSGSWSKEIPRCLKPGCQAPASPTNGGVTLDYEMARAVFNCLDGYILQGPVSLGCLDGVNWNDTAPVCQQITTTTTTTTTTTLKPAIISVKSSSGPAQKIQQPILYALFLGIFIFHYLT